eukprot:5668991-Pleurochrysis_carterae.AAC.1
MVSNLTEASQGRHSARLRKQFVRYNGEVFEMTEADMRAVVHSLGDNAGTWIAEKVIAVRFRFPGGKIVEKALIKWKGWDRE